MRRILILLSCLVAGPAGAAAQGLTLGTVPVGLGASEATVIAQLRTQFAVREIEGGWEVRSRDAHDVRTPLVGIGSLDGKIRDVSFTWGPGLTPSLEAMAEQLSHALPAEATCQIQNVVRAFEGGTVRTLTFQCGRSTVRCQTGVWPQGNTASISISVE